MKAAAAFAGAAPLLTLILLAQGASAQLFGLGIGGFRTVAVPSQSTYMNSGQIVSTPISLPFSFVPLAPGLSLTGTTAYTKSATAPSADCITTALSLFQNCQPFLKAIIDNGGQISCSTILQLLQTAQDKTQTAQCTQSTMNFMNQGCVCDKTTSETINSMPTSSIPQLVKDATKKLSQMMCPNGLVSSTPSDGSSSGGSGNSTPTSGSTSTATAGLQSNMAFGLPFGIVG